MLFTLLLPTSCLLLHRAKPFATALAASLAAGAACHWYSLALPAHSCRQRHRDICRLSAECVSAKGNALLTHTGADLADDRQPILEHGGHEASHAAALTSRRPEKPLSWSDMQTCCQNAADNAAPSGKNTVCKCQSGRPARGYALQEMSRLVAAHNRQETQSSGLLPASTWLHRQHAAQTAC